MVIFLQPSSFSPTSRSIPLDDQFPKNPQNNITKELMGSRQLALAVPVLVLLLLSLSRPSLSSDPRATEAAMMCSNRTTTGATQRQAYIANFLSAMDAMTPAIAKHRFGAVANGTGNETVYALGQCMEDLDGTDCNLCIAKCKTGILSCLPFQLATRAGRLFFDGCYLRYDDYNFFNESLSSLDKTVCSTQETASSNSTLFRDNVKQLVRNLSSLAPNNDGFYAGSLGNGNETAYALAQCWEVLNASSCVTCLDNAASNVTSCVPKQEGRVLNAGCYLRYSDHKFYNNSGSASNGGSSHLGLILAVTSSVVAVVLFAATTLYFVKKRIAGKRRARVEFGDLLAAVNQSKLYYSYESLEKATNYFNHSNKLGQGGSGSVYKGTLSDGKVVAVKRLLFNTRQWVDHFFNEVNLISGIEHKNLVKLLGCSVTGPESLLVYEYIPNQSLQDYLFGTRDVPVQPLTWDMRYKIILGTAEGLAYLNEESEFRIIHRDIKLSNVLLDEDFTAKIADFGLARLFPQDQTHVSTAIAGTLGYMAPEYIVRGHLTEKADVYSFGVLLIEVVTRRRNNSFAQNSCSILQTVWDLYKSGRQSEAVDPALDRNFEEEEASRLLRIGLLCVQASADLRPAMSAVVKMLAENYGIPEPTQPPFLNPMSLAESSVSAGPPGHESRAKSSSQSSKNSMTESFVEPR